MLPPVSEFELMPVKSGFHPICRQCHAEGGGQGSQSRISDVAKLPLVIFESFGIYVFHLRRRSGMG